jgi:starch-binding outer membrane protein, SusD/RagB family
MLKPLAFRRSRFMGVAFGVVLLPLVAAGCDLDEFLEAEDPFTVTPSVAQDTANLETLYAGSRSWFALAYAGQQNREGGVILQTALMTDEMYSADNFTDRQAVDRRLINYQISNASSDDAFINLQRARAEALNAIDLYNGSPREGNARHAELYNIAGFSVVMLAENWCAGIPLSRISSSGITFGDPLTAQQLYELAITYFDAALAMTNAGATQQNLAKVGKGRALLDLGRFADAAAAVNGVPTNFVFNVEYSSGSFETPNAVFNMNNEEHRFSVSLQEGTQNLGLNFGALSTAKDPRILIGAASTASNSGTVPNWLQLKYASQSASIPLATGIEARLIEAEAQMANGTSGSYVATLNALRSTVGLPNLTDPGSATGRIDQLFAERAYWLWLTGHRLSDLRRLVRQYNRNQAQVFPTGLTPYGGSYGTSVSLPVPFEEVNNPNYHGCANTGA